MSLPPTRSLLDPRPAEIALSAPIADAVNIPLGELQARMHELPARHLAIEVAGPGAEVAVEWLRAHGRKALAALDWRQAEGLAQAGRLWQPNPFLMEVLEELTPGVSLDLGCGAGREVVAMAAAGWRATGVDRLSDALDLGRDLAARYLDDDAPSPAWLALDLESEPMPELPEASLVTTFSYLHRPLLRRSLAALPPGGNVAVETFTTTHRDRHGKPSSDDHLLLPGELLDFAAGQDLEVRHFSEGWREGERHTARLWVSRSLSGGARR